jgi:protoporphyrinogen oxidase
MNAPPRDRAVIVGAGPAGLAAAYELVKRNVRPVLLEMGDKPGGIARTEHYKGYRFDIGGHRFFTKNESIMALWKRVLDQGFLRVPRISRIYYEGRFLDYPLNFFNALVRMGPAESALILLSYLRAQIRPFPEENTFEQWVSNRFGHRLYEKFFAPYTAKLWGVPCHQIPADWARQRIKGLSLTRALSDALFGNQKAKSLIHEFFYPEKGPGMMWEAFHKEIEERGGHIRFGTKVTGLIHGNGRITGIKCQAGEGLFEMPVEHIISSAPINELVAMFDGRVPEAVLNAANTLSHRDLILVVLVLEEDALFPDQWIYIHSPGFKVGRIQNFKNWSPQMVADPHGTTLGMEYFCSKDDALSTMSDEELSALAVSELDRLGLGKNNRITDSFVVRQPKAYPVYDDGYRERVRIIRRFLETFENLQTIGRNGMHHYNNMDHSMLTGILAARNVLGAQHDLWSVNEDAEYLEENRAVSDRLALTERVILKSFARMEKTAMGIALGTVSGLLFFVATLWLVVKGGEVVGPNLQLLSQYFFGYTVSVKGAFVALFYGFLWGFLFGWLFAYLRNLMLALYIIRVKKKAERLSLMDFVDHL